MRVSRRKVLATGGALAGLGAISGVAGAATTKLPAPWVRYDVWSSEGQRMLKGYKTAVEAMLALPPTHPHNWFRNAFVHYMDCPHGNWWFYVWHRGYLGYFEQTVRKYSGMSDFAFPYWDWSQKQALPDGMFDGVLTPVADAFARYARDLPTFNNFIQGPLESYYSRMTAAQKNQQNLRGNTTFQKLWDGVAGTGGVDKGDRAFAPTDLSPTLKARYPTRSNPDITPSVAKYCLPANIALGLAPNQFNSANMVDSFTSVKTASHNAMPASGSVFSKLEGEPHNKVHNFIGGAFDGPGNWGSGPFGNMTNNLSPVDPIFFLHHSNMDRLWWLWEEKQKAKGLPTLPTNKDERAQFEREPFLFFWNDKGEPILNGKAGDYIDPKQFWYYYGPPVDKTLLDLLEDLKKPTTAPRLLATAPDEKSVDALAKWPVGLNAKQVQAIITFTRPANSAREYALVVNAPADLKVAGIDSPYYAGSISFFGSHTSDMQHRVTYAVSLDPAVVAKAGGQMDLRLVPTPAWADRAEPQIENLEIRGS